MRRFKVPRLTYNMTQEISYKRTLYGVLVISVVCMTVAVTSVYLNRQDKICGVETIPTFYPERCQPRILNAGETIEFKQAQYVLQTGANYTGGTLHCHVVKFRLSGVIDAFSRGTFRSTFVAKDQWDFNISCGYFDLGVRQYFARSYLAQHVSQALQNAFNPSQRDDNVGRWWRVNIHCAMEEVSNYRVNATTFMGHVEEQPFDVGKLETSCGEVNDIINEELQDLKISSLYTCNRCWEVNRGAWATAVNAATVSSAVFGIVYSLVVCAMKRLDDYETLGGTQRGPRRT